MTTKAQDARHAAAQRLSDGYARGGETAQTADRRRRDERVAAGFRPNPRTERLIELRQSDRAAFDRLPTSVRMGVGYYEGSKSAHDRLRGADDA